MEAPLLTPDTDQDTIAAFRQYVALLEKMAIDRETDYLRLVQQVSDLTTVCNTLVLLLQNLSQQLALSGSLQTPDLRNLGNLS